jgi:hypothetical protein
LLAVAHSVANAELHRRGAYLGGGRYEDLVGYLVGVGCRVAIGYDPARSGNNYSFASFMWDVLARRVSDFYRSKPNGFADVRYYANAPVAVPAGDRMDTLAAVGDEADAILDLEDGDMDTAVSVLGEGLTPAASWALATIVPALADGARISEAAKVAGITAPRAKRALDDLREELAARVRA